MRSAILFLLGILAPCAVMGWVSWRSMRQEATLIQRQRTALYQQAADVAAREAAVLMGGHWVRFAEAVDRIAGPGESPGAGERFHFALRRAWPLTGTAFVVEAETGRVVPQSEPSEQAVTAFFAREPWLLDAVPDPWHVDAGATSAGQPVEPAPVDAPAAKAVEAASAMVPGASADSALPSMAAKEPDAAAVRAMRDSPSRSGDEVADVKAKQEAPPAPVTAGESVELRRVRPMYPAPDPSLTSRVQALRATLPELLRRQASGMASHLAADGALLTLFWYRPPTPGAPVFCAALDSAALRESLSGLTLRAPDADTCLALVDHRVTPAALWMEGSEAFAPERWRAPVVAREIGAALPRWEAVVLLRRPDTFNEAAAAARWRLGMIVVAAAGAAMAGAVFILRDARRTAREAREKTDFVSSVSHELKTPLTSIRMFSDLLAAHPDAGAEKTARYAGVISSEAARLTRLISNVLNFSRMERGALPLQLEPVDLRELVEHTAEQFRPLLEKAGFEFRVTVPDEPAPIRGDADALSQVVLNLLSNAEKYGGEAGGRREVDLTLTQGAGGWEIAVADCGPGVPKGHERRIFEKFHRAHDSLASGTAGSGLGLTISRRLAEAHGGRLEHRARDGGGAIFVLHLPDAAHPAEQVAAAAPSLLPSRESPGPLTS